MGVPLYPPNTPEREKENTEKLPTPPMPPLEPYMAATEDDDDWEKIDRSNVAVQAPSPYSPSVSSRSPAASRDTLFAIGIILSLLLVIYLSVLQPNFGDSLFATFWSYLSPQVGAQFYDVKLSSLDLDKVHGRVLEIGPGTGINLAFYSNQAVSNLVLLEPNIALHPELLDAAMNAGWDLEPSFKLQLLKSPIQSTSLEPDSFDFIISNFVLCSVDLVQSIESIHNWLKPGGTFIFLEHIGDDGGWKRVAQDYLSTFLWPMVGGGCRLNQNTLEIIENMDWNVHVLGRSSMGRGFIPVVWGKAKKKKSWFPLW